MIEKVNQIARDPLNTNEQDLIKSKDQIKFETTVIYNAIIKIGKN